jgi:hypothetical protein
VKEKELDMSFRDRRIDNGIVMKLDLLHGDVQDMKSVLKELTAAISRLAVVESDQGHIRAAQERAFNVLEKLENRMAAVEITAANASRTSGWVDKGVVAVIATVGAYLATRLGLK